MATQHFTASEIQAHSSAKDCWIAIHGKVYDITEFLPEHPGGEEVVLNESGKDATEAFEDVGHSDEAREMLDQYLKGTTDSAVKGPSAKQAGAPTGSAKHVGPGSEGSGMIAYLFPLSILFGWLAYRYYTKA